MEEDGEDVFLLLLMDGWNGLGSGKKSKIRDQEDDATRVSCYSRKAIPGYLAPITSFLELQYSEPNATSSGPASVPSTSFNRTR